MKSKSEYITQDDQRQLAEASIDQATLTREFPAQIASGKPFIFAAAQADTKSSIWGGRPAVVLFIAQARPLESGKNLDSDPDGIGPIEPWLLKLKGWDQPVVRHIETLDEASVDALGWEVGTILPDMNIMQKDSLDPKSDTKSMNPRATRVNEHGVQFVYVNKANKPIYRFTKLTQATEELDVCMDYRASKLPLVVHQRMQRDRMDAEAQKAAALAAQEAQKAAALAAQEVAEA